MNIGQTLDVSSRKEWREWLSKHHSSENEIWLVFYRKDSGKQRIFYNDAVEEALCYGWIDSIVKRRDAESRVQRFSPRKPKSELSEMNKERIRRLIASKKMRKAGLTAISRHLSSFSIHPKDFVFPKDILNEIRKNPVAWKHYQKFPLSYRRIRIGWIIGARSRPDIFRTRLRYFITKTEKNVRYGMVQ
ncbi:MAG: YdeI/OmpD-associated family protein [Bacteriovoracaceae bacterium]